MLNAVPPILDLAPTGMALIGAGNMVNSALSPVVYGDIALSINT